MKSVAQMVSFFEQSSKPNIKPVKNVKSPPKINVPTQFKQQLKIITPAGGIPKYYGIAQAPKVGHQQARSPKLVKNPEFIKEPEKIDKNKIKENMANMKALLEKKQIHKRPFRIEPCLNANNANANNNVISFKDRLNMFEGPSMKLVYDVKPIRNVKKKTKNVFHE